LKISKKTTLAGVVVIPLLTAIVIRTILYMFWLQSPVRYYSNILGLDMQTTLIIGSWLYQGFSIFTIHKFMIAAVMFFNHGQHSPEALILIQIIMGAIAAPVIAWCALHLTGKRLWAMASGIIAATYAPALLHECLTLRESTQVFFAALSLFGLLWGRKRHFDITGLIVAGTCLSLPCLVRVSSAPFLVFGSLWIVMYLFSKYKRKRLISKQLFIRIGVLAAVCSVIFGSVMLFNARNATTKMPFYIDWNYAFKLGKVENPKDMNVGPLQSASPVIESASVPEKTVSRQSFSAGRYLNNCICKFYLLFKPFEISNNVNYYFMKYKLFPLQYLAGPLLVIPLAFTAILFILCSWQWMRKEGLLLLYILAYSMPLVFFYPLARYRLIMYPVFAILMFYPFFRAYSQMKRHNTILMILPMLLLWVAVLLVTFPANVDIRATDFVAYGKAIQYQAGKATDEAGQHFQAAIEQEPDYIPGYINYADNLIKMGQYQQAHSLLADAYVKFRGDNGIAYYYGISLLGVRDPARAESVFRKIPVPGSSDDNSQYYYYLGEALRLQNKLPEALKLYKAGLESAKGRKRDILQKLVDDTEKRIHKSVQP
jgi:tetratricopeptide (TPR) repeat protein